MILKKSPPSTARDCHNTSVNSHLQTSVLSWKATLVPVEDGAAATCFHGDRVIPHHVIVGV